MRSRSPSSAFDAEHGGTGCGQFDGQGETPEPTADRYDRHHISSVWIEVGRRGLCRFDKQPDSAILRKIALTLGGRHRGSEGWHGVDPLSVYVERLAGCCNDVCRRIGAQQRLAHRRRCIDDMLAIVEHDEELFAAQRIGDTFR
jgi:hypothetical protein